MSARPDAPQPASAAPPRQLSGWRASYARFCSKPVVLAVAVTLLIAHRAVVILDDPAEPEPTPVMGVTTPEIRARILVGLAVELRNQDTRVEDVTCTRDSDTHATCEAQMSGENAGAYAIDVRIDPSTQRFDWFLGGSPAPR